MKWQIIILTILMILPIVMAEQGTIETYLPNQVFTLGLHLSNITGDVTGASCNIQIRNSSYDVLLNSQLGEIGNGYYNITYSTGKVGSYFCRQNCTLGTSFTAGTCDFIIGGNSNMSVTIIIGLIMLFIIGYYIYLAKNFNLDIFEKHGAIKLLFFLGTFWIMLIPMNFAIYLTNTFLANDALTDTLGYFFNILIWVNTLISFYFILWLIKSLVEKMRA